MTNHVIKQTKNFLFKLEDWPLGSHEMQKRCKCSCRSKYYNDDVWYCCSCDDTVCFPSAAKIHLENGKTVEMSELKTGDRIQTGIFEENFKVRQHQVDISFSSVTQSDEGKDEFGRSCACYCRKKGFDEWYCCQCQDTVCFPSTANVQVFGGETVTMSDLSNGDLVLSGM